MTGWSVSRFPAAPEPSNTKITHFLECYRAEKSVEESISDLINLCEQLTATQTSTIAGIKSQHDDFVRQLTVYETREDVLEAMVVRHHERAN